jgi:hypothetical protein
MARVSKISMDPNIRATDKRKIILVHRRRYPEKYTGPN